MSPKHYWLGILFLAFLIQSLVARLMSNRHELKMLQEVNRGKELDLERMREMRVPPQLTLVKNEDEEDAD